MFCDKNSRDCFRTQVLFCIALKKELNIILKNSKLIFTIGCMFIDKKADDGFGKRSETDVYPLFGKNRPDGHECLGNLWRCCNAHWTDA